MAAASAVEGAAPCHIGAFCKYEKMGEDSGSAGAAAVTADANRYVVTEKVHGANFCLIAAFPKGSDRSAVEVRFAKRTAIIGSADDAEDFYSCRSTGLLRTLARYAEQVLRRCASDSQLAGFEAVHVYGELFGGSYPHPEVPPAPGLQPVQVGVWYSPGLEFMAFDVAVESSTGRRFLDFHLARALCEACGLMFAQPLCQGTLAECLEFGVEFESTIPRRLGLPALPPGAGGGELNLAEGVVTRPLREPRLQHRAGGRGKESLRGLFKRKIEAFSEKRYQNNDWRRGKAGGAGVAAHAPDNVELLRLEVAALVTEQRLANVLSKTGRISAADREACRRLLRDLQEDVVDALEPEDAAALQRQPVVAAELDAMCRELITRELRAAARREAAAVSGAARAQAIAVLAGS